jgi:hypothetical protein
MVAGPLWAEVQVTATVEPPVVRMGESVVLEVTVSGERRDLPEPVLPDLSQNFEVENEGTSSRFQIVNRTVTTNYTRRYRLYPKRVGNLAIAPVTVKDGDREVRSEHLMVQVQKGAAPPAPPDAAGEASGSTSGSPEIFVRASVDNATPFVNEQVTYRVRLYTLPQLLESPGFTAPTTQGFWKEMLPPRDPKLEVVDGKRYRVLEVAMAVFPSAPGELTIGEAVLNCNVRAPQSGQENDPFRSFFDRFEGRRVVLRTDPITLNVKPLPQPAPEGFQGAVGEFRIDMSVDRTESDESRPVNVTLRVTGEGNLRTVPDLAMPEMPGFRTYPASTDRSEQSRGLKFAGALIQKFVLVPLEVGRNVIPAIELVTFSPRYGRYRTVSTDPVPILVSSVSEDAIAAALPGDVEILNSDIRFIATEVPTFHMRGSGWKRAQRWLWLLPLPALGLAGVWVWDRRRRRLGADRAALRRSQARSEALERLKRAARTDPAQHAPLAADALRGYLADRFDLPKAGLTLEDITRHLGAAGLEPEPVQRFLEGCDAVRFAPGAAPAPADWLREAQDLIQALEEGR